MPKRSIQIYTVNANTGVLEMGFLGNAPAQCAGVQVLLERIAKLLRTDMTSNLFNPEIGSSLGSRGLLTSDDGMTLQVIVQTSVQAVRDFIITEQTFPTGADVGVTLTPDQTLQDLQVSSIIQGEDPTTWYVELLVITASNETFFLTV